jgi:hypothetical protein
MPYCHLWWFKMKKILLLIFYYILNFSDLFALEIDPNHFEILSFSSIVPNKVSFNKGIIHVSIKDSASPLIYPFSQPRKFKSIKVSGNIIGKLNLEKKKQGQKNADDFTFRLGLVLEGDKTLNFFQRQFAPAWITKLYSLGKKANASGIEKIIFYNVVQDNSLIGNQRQHPLSDLLYEKFVTHTNSQNHFEILLNEKDLPSEKILALWISSDGDDTHSSYEVTISQFSLIP